MTNPMFNPQPVYSGVTIQISNPSVNVGGNCGVNSPNQAGTPYLSSGYINAYTIPNGYNVQTIKNKTPQNSNYISYPQGSYGSLSLPDIPANKNASEDGINNNPDMPVMNNGNPDNGSGQYGMTNPLQNKEFANSYPAEYYLQNYNYKADNKEQAHCNRVRGQELSDINGNSVKKENYQNGLYEEYSNNSVDNKAQNIDNNAGYVNKTAKSINENESYQYSKENIDNNITADEDKVEMQNSKMNSYKMYADKNEPKDTDMTRSKTIIGDLDEREAEIAEEKKNTKETKIVALTDEYIKSLENYLNNPNDEIRLMASKEVLTRLDEDKDRYNDAALNALLNKMMQDPNKLVRIASLSAFASQLASGNDYTVQLLHNIQSNPNSDKEDVLQAADILLKMSAGVEVKNIPNPSVKDKNSIKE